MTPEDVHYGRGASVTRMRQMTLDAAYNLHPERFVKKAPKAPVLPKAVWINPPSKDQSGLLDDRESNDEKMVMIGEEVHTN